MTEQAVLESQATEERLEPELEVAVIGAGVAGIYQIERLVDLGVNARVLEAADDLGVSPGDSVTVEHPVRQGDGFVVVQTRIRVAGVHPNPFRRTAYIDRSVLGQFGLLGATNSLYVLPAPGHDVDDVERELFGLDGVASVTDHLQWDYDNTRGDFTSPPPEVPRPNW